MKKPIPFGKYYLLERVNVGGMAEVFKAKTYGVEGFERLLAVKRILPNIAEDEEFITMFIDEAKIAVQLNHANIAQIFDLGKVDESYFIALEYVHGKDLRAMFDRCRALTETMPISQACFIIMKICEGLDYAHNKRDSTGREMHLVHRDVSPQNILISYEGEVKLVDFGIAKAAGKASKTEAGILKGKFGYMSPEQVRGLPLDRRSDIFSVAIVLYELLTGERLFLGESDFSTLEKVRNVEILPPSTYNRKVAEELEQIVLKGLAKDVEDRYQNAIDLHDDLQAYMYTSGEFYSRKDLAGWMKPTWAREIEEEGRKLEEYRHLPPPSHARPPVPPGHPTRPPPPPGGNGKRAPSASMPALRPPPVPEMPQPPVARSTGEGLLVAPTMSEQPVPALSWDDEEVETQIYDKPGVSSPDLGLAASEAVASVDHVEPLDHAQLPALDLPVERTGRGARQHPTMPVAPMPAVVPRAPVAARRGHLAIWLTLALIAMLACGGVLYYFLVLGMKPGNVSVVAIPSDVVVYLDGKLQPGNTPLTIRSLKPGPYIVSVSKPGFQRWTKTVEVKPGETIRLTPQLEALTTASVELRTTPSGGDVYLDGRKLEGETPMKITQVTPGKHRLEVRKPPYQPWVHEFEAQPDQVLRLTGKLLPSEVAVAVKTTPRAEVFLVRDGKRESMGLSPVTMRLDPKFSYMVAVEKEGYKAWQRPVSFDGDGPIELQAVLAREVDSRPHIIRPRPPRPTPPRPRPPEPRVPDPLRPRPPRPVGMGTLLINSNPWTKIIIDGTDTGLTTPQRSIPLSAGRHVITLRNPKFNIDISFPVAIQAGQQTKVIKRNLSGL